MQTYCVYLSVGSNMGDPMVNCCRAIETLRADGRVALSACSPFYRTQPVDYPDQAWFINAALRVATTLTPTALLDFTQAIQRQLGRKKSGIRFGPRIVDLDIIFYGNQVIETPHLVVPHPRMHKRRFVLQPICDIDPDVVHPVLGRTVKEMLGRLPTDDQELIPCSSGC